MDLFKSLSIPVDYYFLDSLTINVPTDELYRLALKLSEIRSVNNVRNGILEERKRTLFDLLQIPGETGNESDVRNYVIGELENLKK